ncbi:MAG: ABC transporter ATP-binding protein/permease [Erysipelotrichaceae bacterium]|nr:ABC transporter ATP-binding protein/permease [Erysipelotrichaceae bacterium]
MMINKRLISSVPEIRKELKKNVIFQWLGLLCTIGFSFFLALAAQHVILGLVNLSLMFVLFASIFMLGRMLMSYLASKVSGQISRQVKTTLRERLMNHLMDLNSSYSTHHLTSEVVQLCTEGVDQLETYFAQYLPQLFYAIVSPVTLFLVLFKVHFKAAIVLFVCVPLIPVSIILVQKFAKKLLSKYWGKYTALSDIFLENLQGLTTLKVFDSDQRQHERMNQAAEDFRIITMKVLTMQLNSISIMDAVAYGGTALGIYFAVYSFLYESADLWATLLIVLLSAEFFLPMRLLGSYFHIAMNGMAASDRMFSLIDQKPAPSGTCTVSLKSFNLDINNLSFSYSDGKEALHCVSFNIPQGSFLGIAGPSGSGKSTLAKLLCGDVLSINNEILISHQPIHDFSFDTRKQFITKISSQPSLFKGSLRDNLRMGNPEANDDELWEALKKCQLAEFFLSMQGLDTPILESGSNLSNGQKQRISLARAILHDSPIYLFDEATSAIDADSEEAILHEIEHLRKTKTIIMISHRLANLKTADNIIVLDQGHLVEEGTYHQLITHNGLFAQMAHTQNEIEHFDKEVSL